MAGGSQVLNTLSTGEADDDPLVSSGYLTFYLVRSILLYLLLVRQAHDQHTGY